MSNRQTFIDNAWRKFRICVINCAKHEDNWILPVLLCTLLAHPSGLTLMKLLSKIFHRRLALSLPLSLLSLSHNRDSLSPVN